MELQELRIGDALECRCLYTNTETSTLTYGLSARMEMCGPVVVYTPHNVSPSLRPTWWGGAHGTQKEKDADAAVARVPSNRDRRPDYPEWTS